MKEEMEKMKKKMKTMFYQNLEIKEYVKSGTLFTARKTWEVRSHMMSLETTLVTGNTNILTARLATRR